MALSIRHARWPEQLTAFGFKTVQSMATVANAENETLIGAGLVVAMVSGMARGKATGRRPNVPLGDKSLTAEKRASHGADQS
jgi:hypothetical protein